MKRPLLAGLAILVAWMLLDLLMHRLFLKGVLGGIVQKRAGWQGGKHIDLLRVALDQQF